MIRGKITYLRPTLAADIPAITLWENDPEIQSVSDNSGRYSEADIAAFFLRESDLFSEGQLRLVICDIHQHRCVGALDLFDFNAAQQKCGVGILIGAKDDRTKGYATDALAATLDFAVASLGIRTFECLIFPDNVPSVGLFEKAQFKPTGIDFFNNKKAIRYQRIFAP